MSDYLSTITYLPPIEEFGQHAPGRESQSSPSLFCSLPIHTLNDDVLLNIFYLYRLDVPDEYHGSGEPNTNWRGQRWWYKLAQVCRRWRYLILASPSRLGLHLLCTNHVPIANMLAHSPPLPLTIYYSFENHDYNGYPGSREAIRKDEEGILLALRHSDRVHHIFLHLPAPKLRKIIKTMDEQFQFPILERLYIWSRIEDDTSLVLPLPRTFQAPHLRQLDLRRAALPIGSPLLTSTVGLVTLELDDIPLSAHFPPNNLLTWLSLMPQLELLGIRFHSPLLNHDVARQLLDTPIMTHIALPNLRRFIFTGVSAYLDDLLARISAPVLSTLSIVLFHQLAFTVSHLSQFMGTSEKILKFSAVLLDFNFDSFGLRFNQPGKGDNATMWIIKSRHLDQQVASAVQVLTALQPVLSVVEQLILGHLYRQSSEGHNEVDRTLWRQLLRPFNNLKTLYVQGELERFGKLARSLQTDDGEPPLELLPNLKEVVYSGGCDARAFTPFIDERQVAGHPVNLTMVDRSVFTYM
ncbi:hypothetical protein BJV78DRAFT_910103 [Lactifluus subvellereus]|nr:hypothetical protein BJV78DRAFT_910103 [Lactifluus subvellereus]